MSDTVIRVENLGKFYRIGVKEKAPTRTLLKTVTGLVGTPFKYLRSVLRTPGPEEVIWSLKDISFEVKQGEVLGIIGHNGAGKSTLLKILSQITEPSCGYAEIRGRVGSLLEVGTGFHPDLTGRENTYLNGTIMGMKRREIDRRFDEIVAFAEVEKFIDTPVKFYSSGMYTRLAFAVAAHLEPEILILDEVLAVGDIQFQKKCIEKMDNVSNDGRTVLFVSHNVVAVQQLCNRAMYLNLGRVEALGETVDVVKKYAETVNTYSKHLHYTSSFVELKNTVSNGHSSSTETFTCFPGKQCVFQLALFSNEVLKKCYLNLVIQSENGNILIHERSDQQNFYPCFEPGSHKISVTLKSLNLQPGCYFISFRIYSRQKDKESIVDSNQYAFNVAGKRQFYHGFVYSESYWELSI